MARIFLSEQTGADVVVFSKDHCPPHATALHRAHGWVARVKFSFVTNNVDLWDIEPVRRQPRKRIVDDLLDEIEDHLEDCRRNWWDSQRTVCLDRRWALEPQSPSAAPLVLLARKRPDARRLSSATYDADTRTLTVSFVGGTEVDMIAGTGEDA